MNNGDSPVVPYVSSLERATRIELAFAAWEAAYRSFSCEENCLIRTRFLRTEFGLRQTWASNGQDPSSGATWTLPIRELRLRLKLQLTVYSAQAKFSKYVSSIVGTPNSAQDEAAAALLKVRFRV
jgi:hypothetical protein